MAMRISGAAIGEIQTLFRWGAMGAWTDGQLLAQFLAGQAASEAAFRVLIHRHGPMVLGICRRVLGDEHAAEDAFQATFLVLVKKAGTLRDGDLLTNWLYGVALQVANKEKARRARRRGIERQAAERRGIERQAAEQTARPEGDLDRGELRSMIDEEIRRLPERYRLPLVLCHMEGLRHEEVARRLGCPVGTVESRLSRARERLRSRLARRGLAPMASALGAVLRPTGGGLLVPSLVEVTLQVAIRSAPQRSGFKMMSAWSLVEWFGRFIPAPLAGTGTVASALVIGAGLVAIGLGAFRFEREAPQPGPPPLTAVELPQLGPPLLLRSSRRPMTCRRRRSRGATRLVRAGRRSQSPGRCPASPSMAGSTTGPRIVIGTRSVINSSVIRATTPNPGRKVRIPMPISWSDTIAKPT